MQKTVSGDVNQTTIHDLDPNTAYDVQMSANTKAGASNLSEVISVPISETGIQVTELSVANPKFKVERWPEKGE